MSDKYYTFTFNIDPELNFGMTEVFKQGDEPWWWYVKEGWMPAAGPEPDFTGATFKSLHEMNKKLV